MDTKKSKPGSKNDTRRLVAVETSPPVGAVRADPWSRRVPPADAGTAGGKETA